MRTNSEYILTEWLVLQAQEGHVEALEQLLELWYPKLIRYAKLQTRSDEDAKDAVQDCLLIVARKLIKLKDPITFPKWIYTILHRRSIDKVRQNVSKQRLLQEKRDFNQIIDELRQDDIGSSHLDTKIDLFDALQQLEQSSALLVHLHYLEGLTMSEIAEVTKVPVGTVKSRLFAARKSMKKLLDEY